MRRRNLLTIIFLLLVSPGFQSASWASPEELKPVAGIESQPLVAQARRVKEALAYIGRPLSAEEAGALDTAIGKGGAEAVKGIQAIFAPHVLFSVHINPESRVKVGRGPAAPECIQQGWRAFLVRVHNEAGVTAQLQAKSPNAKPVYKRSSGSADPKVSVTPAQVGDRWMDVQTFDSRPLNKTLSGLALEYRIVEIYSRDAGKREAKIEFNVGQGTQDLGFRNEVNVLFDCIPSTEVVLGVSDYDGKPASASFVIRDTRGRIYPHRSRRLEPDFFFHAQIYRHHGESISLPPGKYSFEYGRGPEYFRDRMDVVVPSGQKTSRANFKLRRWFHAKKLGWYSGDHHVHAAGCSHYESPNQGVTPKSMMRHILGEDLNVGCVLSWGPCWYFQKQFFDGRVSDLSKPDYLMRYDVEVSGFPSSHAGHLCLLRLKEDDYPGTTKIEEWPSWDLPVLAWGKKQGGVVGFSHSGWGLDVKTADLPNYVIPPFNSIGANEYIVDVVHGVVDFISTVDTPYVWELNIWYHTLNCGFRTRISGETDFPCIYGERVGLGRVYCKLDGKLDFDRFCEELKNGRSYVGDGRSHLVDFKVGTLEVGTRGSEVRLDKPGKVKITTRVAAMLDEKPNPDLRGRPYQQKPYWHIERARLGGTRKVPVEVIVNGEPVFRKEIAADGKLQDFSAEVELSKSSWVALRILPSCHTNPVFVIVGDKPIRASKKSAQWCLESVDQCWKQKKGRIRKSELAEASKAYEDARRAYRKILSESAD